jgi:hypothetical protein
MERTRWWPASKDKNGSTISPLLLSGEDTLTSTFAWFWARTGGESWEKSGAPDTPTAIWVRLPADWLPSTSQLSSLYARSSVASAPGPVTPVIRPNRRPRWSVPERIEQFNPPSDLISTELVGIQGVRRLLHRECLQSLRSCDSWRCQTPARNSKDNGFEVHRPLQ